MTESITTTPEWLIAEPVVERVALDQTSWVDVVRTMVPSAGDVYDELLTSTPWQQGKVFRYEKWIEEPRLSSWQHGFSGHQALVDVQHWISRRYRVMFDGCALALYRNERDSVGFHRDRELRYLEDTVIGVLTLGAQRPWLMRPLDGRRPDEDDLTGVIDLAPASGDLFVMGGRAQAAWLHAVPRVTARCAPRISAQWRWTSRRGRRDPNPGYYAPRHFTTNAHRPAQRRG